MYRRRTRARAFALAAALLALAGCSSGGSNRPSATALPGELVGEWQAVLTYLPGYWEGAIPVGDFSGSLGVFVYLWPEGRYEYALNSALAYFGGNCFRTTSRTEYGAVVGVQGAAVTFRATHILDSVLDSCGQSRFDQLDPGAPATFVMTPEQDPTGWPLLRLGLPSGEEVLLEKCRQDC